MIFKDNEWIEVELGLPEEGQRVIAKYEGVYTDRVVTFWTDAGGRYHFGAINEADGKGSQPATHWKPFHISRSIPSLGSKWRHENGDWYAVILITNEHSTRDDYPTTVCYMDENGRRWSKTLKKWHEKMTPHHRVPLHQLWVRN